MVTGLTPPGSSSYSSNTLHVGDGTWDTQRDDFLLPNLVGLNFATMRYNGMGSRFRGLTQYHSLIRAHGIIAAITFLGIVPAAILIARFYSRTSFWALRMHIWLQVVTFLLTTVIFILGFMAVGPERALTNPHHGIGVALYVLIIWQILSGWWIHKRETRRRLYIPLKLMVHKWLGRATALLGIVQIPLGLTLYGSPKVLFVLYTLAAFALLLTYFILTWMHQRRVNDFDSRGSYISGTEEVVEDRHRHSRLGRFAALGAAGAGIAALGRFRRRSRSRSRADVVSDVTGTSGHHRPSGSYISEEKYSDEARHDAGWGKTFLKLGALGGVAALAKRAFSRKNRDDEDSDLAPYRPPLGGNQSYTDDSVSRIEEGRPPLGGQYPLPQTPTRPLGHRRSESSISYYSSMSGSPRKGHPVRQLAAGALATIGLRNLFKSRRKNKEERRVEEMRQQEIEAERIARANSQGRYTGDGYPGRRLGRRTSQSSTDFTASVSDSRPHLGGVAPVVAGGLAGTAAVSALSDRDRIRPPGTDPIIPGPSTAPFQDIPPIPPTHRVDSSGSELYTGTDGRQHHRHHPGRDTAAAGLAGAALGAAAAEGSRRRHSGRHEEQVESPPVSVKVKMHNDGRHVTLRRLTEEEAAAQREARRRERSRHRRRAGSGSSLSGNESSSRWRRTEAIERAQAEEIRRQHGAAAGSSVGSTLPPPPPGPPPAAAPIPGPSATGGIPPPMAQPPPLAQGYSVPPPPPIPATGSGVTSPGTLTGTESTDYATNRRRRRAERAQARQARQQQQGVEFT